MSLFPQNQGIIPLFRAGFCDHSKPVLGLSGLLSAIRDFLTELFLGVGIVRFAVIGSDTASRANYLANQRLRNRVYCQTSRETYHCLTKLGCPLLKVKSRFITHSHNQLLFPIQINLFPSF